MKKLNYLLIGAAGLIMASCANDDLQAPNAEGLQITVNLADDASTRADASTPMLLSYAVYDESGNLVEDSDDIKFTGSHTLGLSLLSGKSYNIAFFATVDGVTGVYDFNKSEKSVSVDYSAMNNSEANNSGNYDCFYGSVENISGTSSGVSVTLVRPLAQINWGSNDLTANSVKNTFGEYGTDAFNMYATLETELYSSFDIFNGELSGDKSTVELGAFAAPVGDEFTYPAGTNMKYVGIEYVLAAPTSELYDLNLKVSNAQTGGNTTDVVVTSAPLQANYRTNIYGSLLTDQFSINIDLGPWGGNILDPQDEGDEVYTDLFYNATSKTYTIKSATGLNNYAVNIGTAAKGNTGLSGTTVVLDADIDLKNVDYTPFYLAGAKFDGQGHTVSNLTYAAPMDAQNNAGFILAGPGTVQNLTFTDATVSGPWCAGVVVGYAIATHINNVTVKDSKVTSTPWLTASGKYDDGNNVGAIAGYSSAEGTASISNCNVSGCTITGYRKVGGLTGIANGNCIVSGNTVSNTTITANQQLPNSGVYVSDSPFLAGEFAGDPTTATFSNNTATNVTVLTINSSGAFTVGSYEELAAIAKLGSKPLYGKTIQLTQNIDLGGQTVEGLNFGAESSDFNNSIIDGQGYTISNFKVVTPYSTALAGHNGFIVNFHGEIKDLIIDNMTINDDIHGNVSFVGYFVGTMSGVTVKNSTITTTNSYNNVGGLVGITTDSTYEDCNVENCTLSGNNRIGGLVGALSGGSFFTATDCNVSDTKITALDKAGTIYGNNASNVKVNISGCTVSKVSINGTEYNSDYNN